MNDTSSDSPVSALPAPAPLQQAEPRHLLQVLVALPGHSSLASAPLHYTHHKPLPTGTLVRVPLGQRIVQGVVWEAGAATAALPEGVNPRPILEDLSALPVLDASWRKLMMFVAHYYQRSPGEVALAALPPQLRALNAPQLARRLKTMFKKGKSASDLAAPSSGTQNTAQEQQEHEQENATPDLTDEQAAALNAIVRNAQQPAPAPVLLFGSTGSGKTEVYLRAVAHVLEQDDKAQALVMVPEINLTPQLQQRFAQRFPQQRMAVLHSGTTPAQRLQGWLAAHTGLARIVLGTRMAVLASMPHLRLIVVDEEHDPSYKQQEGARYSARDLAVYRAHQQGISVLLGSATPSLESWHLARPAGADDAGGRYVRLEMHQRIGAARLPAVRVLDMAQQPRKTVCSPALLAAIQTRVERGEQSLLLLNRRGYAPVLHCPDCGWKSACLHCSAYRVFHKTDRTLRCHHCGYTTPVPRACPDCGNQDVRTLGLGTEQLEESLRQELHTLRRTDGAPPGIVRIDADTTRRAGSLEQQLAQAHSGAADILVGTQMLAKGHDFRHITLVAALNPDSALFSSDFRAPERLFALLMQAGGRAGRDPALSAHSELWVQTRFPTHPLFAALQKHNYPGFAAQQLAERQAAGMPPFSYQALVRAEAREQQTAQDFLNAVSQSIRQLPFFSSASVQCYPAVPMVPQRVANRERAQMLLEGSNRKNLQRLLHHMQALLHQNRHAGILHWAVDVDPLAV